MSIYRPARTLWNLNGSGLTTKLTVSGNSGNVPIDIGDLASLWLAVAVVGTSTGTNPTLDVQLDVQDADGNWFLQVAKITQITAGPGSASVSCGMNIGATNAIVLPRYCRVAWTVGGTASPTFPQTSISLTGR